MSIDFDEWWDRTPVSESLDVTPLHVKAAWDFQQANMDVLRGRIAELEAISADYAAMNERLIDMQEQFYTKSARVNALEAAITKAKAQEPVATLTVLQQTVSPGRRCLDLITLPGSVSLSNGKYALYLNPFPDESRGNFFIEFWCGACSTTDRKACQCRRFPEDGE